MIEQIAFGELRMSYEDLYNMNPKNFANAQIGYKKMYVQNQQAEWERARWMACVIINPHLKKSISPKKITTFQWEKKVKKTAKADVERLLRESKYQDKLDELNEKKLKKNA